MNERNVPRARSPSTRRVEDRAAHQYVLMVDELRLRDLQFICEISATKSLSRSAERFGMTQPAASRLLSQLEQRLDTRLFERNKSEGMIPTTPGTLVVGRAFTVLADMLNLASELVAFKSGVKGQLRLGTIFFVSASLQRELMLELMSPPSELRVSVKEGDSPDLVELLHREMIDAALARCPVPDKEGVLFQQPLFQQTACVIVHPGAARGAQSTISQESLRSYAWILPPEGSPTRLAFDAAMMRQGLRGPSPVIETASSKIIHAMTSSTKGFAALVPAEIGADLAAMGGVVTRALPFSLDMPSIGFLCLRRHLHEPVVSRCRASVARIVARGLGMR